MNMVIAQSGGPSMVINGSLVGAVVFAKQDGKGRIGRIYGARHGIAGILKGDYVDLRKVPFAKLRGLLPTPSSALGSCRLKPTPEDCRYPLVVYHIPKTIDNDLRSCDHTPGFGSAARFVACALKGDDLDNRALGGVKIDIIMGRDAGFLTAASALARERPDDGPHLIYMPEVPFTVEKFVRDVKAAMKKYGRCVCAVSEGVRGKDGVPIGAKLGSGEKDSHGNVQMSGTGALGDYLARELKARAGVKRVRADTFGYLQRSFPGMQSRSDLDEAMRVGAAAVVSALKAAGGDADFPTKGTIGIVRRPGRRYDIRYEAMPAEAAAKYTRSVPKEFIAKNGHDVTPAFIEYARPVVGELPRCEVI